MSMDGQADICSCYICTSTIRGGRIPQGARKAVRLCPWMGGMSQGARDGGVTNVHGWADRFLLLQYLHFHHPWWSAENCSMHFPHFHHPWWSYSARSQEDDAAK